MAFPKMQRNKERFRRFLEKRFSLRLHMFLILAGVFCVGVLSSKLLLEMRVRSMLIRYPIAVICSYIVFFGLVKLWLIYLSSSAGIRKSILDSGSGRSGGGFPDFSFGLSGSGSRGSSFSGGGGGSFGGGGASASFDGPAEISVPACVVSSSDSGGSFAGDVAGGTGKAVSDIFDGDGTWVLIVLGILLAIACGAGIYLIWQAPMILSDAAFQAVLSTSLLSSMKKMSDPDWMKGILRTTVFPFAVVLAMSIAAAWMAHHSYPQATRMSEVVRYLQQ